MRLYRLDLDWAPNPRRVSIYMAEKGLSIPWTELDSSRMEHKSDWFLALNPAGKVPVLVLDHGRAICDSAAIVEYLDEVSDGPLLMGSTSEERAAIRAAERMITDLLWLTAVVARNTHPYFATWGGKQMPQSPEAANYARPRAQALLGAVDALIGDKPFVAGKQVSVADCTLCATLDFAIRFASMTIGSELPRLSRWNAMFASRPSAAAK